MSTSSGAAAGEPTRVAFDPSNFVDPTTNANGFHPLHPGTQWVRGGTTEVGSRKVPHQVISTMTDVVRTIDGCSIKQVQRAMGHESATITLDTYAAWWPNSDDELRDAVQTVLGADGTQTESEHDEPLAPNETRSRKPHDAQRPEVG